MSLPSTPKRCCFCNQFSKCKRADFCPCRKNGTPCTCCLPSDFHLCSNTNSTDIHHPSHQRNQPNNHINQPPESSTPQHITPKNPYKKSSSLPSKTPHNPYPQPQRKHPRNPFYAPSNPIPYRKSPTTSTSLPSANPFVTQQRSIPFKRTANTKPSTTSKLNSTSTPINPKIYHENRPTKLKPPQPNPYLRTGLSIDKPRIRNPYIKTTPTPQKNPSLNSSETSTSTPSITDPKKTSAKPSSTLPQTLPPLKHSSSDSSYLPSDNDMDIDSVISQLESDELSHDYSVHDKKKKKIKITQLPTQINVNRFPINSQSISSSESNTSNQTSHPSATKTSTAQSSSTSPHTSEFKSPPIPPYPITNPPQHPETIQDLQHQTEHPIDTELIKLYGDTVHRNLGTHLTGNIDNNSQWYYLWFQLISYHHPLYTPPQSKLGRDIVKTLTEEFQGVREQKWNSEKALLFPIIILRKPHQKLTSQEIKSRLRFRLQQWKQGEFIALATDTITEAYQFHTSKSPTLDIEEKLLIFNQLVCHGKLSEALRFLTNKHEENAILQPSDIDLKTGKSVLEVLKSKHPPIRIQDITQEQYNLDKYEYVPQPLALQITEENVKEMASNLHGSGGPTSLDSSILSDLLLRYGTSSTSFRQEMATWTEWLSNESPPWAAYRATMATRAVAFNKFPGVRPISIGESYRRLWARLIISQTRDQAKAACNTTELCAGLEAGIDGAIHAVRASTLNKSSFQTQVDTYHENDFIKSTTSPNSCLKSPSVPTPPPSSNSSSTSQNTSPTSPPIINANSSPPNSPSTTSPIDPRPLSSIPTQSPPKIPPNNSNSTNLPSSTTHEPPIKHPYNLRP